MTERILPWDVRYALQHRDARLVGDDIETLASNGFGRLAFYMAMKAMADHPEEQIKMAQVLENKGFDLDEVGADDVSIASEHLRRHKKTVNGMKLGQIFRHGPSQWQRRYDNAAERNAEAIGNSSIVLVAHSTLVGIDSFASRLEDGASLLVVRHDSVVSECDDGGFKLTQTNGMLGVSSLDSPFERPSSAVLLDDTENSGKTIRDMIDFWTADGSEAPKVDLIF